MNTWVKTLSHQSPTIDIPLDHEESCTCEFCFPNRFFTRDYTRRVIRRLCESWSRLYPPDVILLECWIRNRNLPVPLDTTEIRAIVDDIIATNQSEQHKGRLTTTATSGANRMVSRTGRKLSKGVQL